MRVKELVKLLKTANQEAKVVVAPVPFRTGYTNNPLKKLGRSGSVVVIGLTEECAFGEDELKIDW